MNDTYENVRDLINCELEEVTRSNSVEPGLVHYIGELVDILKDLDEIEMSGGYEGNYSSRGYMNSYNDGGNMWGKRDRYYNTGYRGNSRNSGNRGMYSRDDAKMRMIEKLENALDDATSQSDRDAIQKLIAKMENK